MKYIFHIRSNEKGSTLLISVLILLLLTVIGIAATNTSTIEILISGNDKVHKMVFYTAESGWRVAVNWLDFQYPLITVHCGMNTTSGNIHFSQNKYSAPDDFPLSSNNSYSAKVRFVGAQPAPPGYGTDFKRFVYEITSTGTGPRNAESQVTVTAGKIEYVGGY